MTNVWLLSVVYYLTYIHFGSADNCSSYRNVTPEMQQKAESEVTFFIYNRKHPGGFQISLNSTDDELASGLIRDIPVKLITHGWMNNESGNSVATLKDAYLRTTDLNVITVGWGPLADGEYVLTTFRVKVVGIIVGRMVSRFLNIGLTSLGSIHLIGHSLGAHVMGVAGGFIRDCRNGKVSRISGLDTAEPFYEDVRSEDSRLNREDARFVDAIHTCIGILGYAEPVGHVDFYPNGGYCNQPGCSPFDLFCDHARAFQYYKESIVNKYAYPATSCSSYFKYELNGCQSNQIVYMGNPTPPSARGIFYLKTDAEFTP